MSANNFVTSSEASELTDKSLRTIQNYIKNGKLSATKDDAGNYLIDKAELYRVFPEAHIERKEAQIESTEAKLIALELENQFLKERISEHKNQHDLLTKLLEQSALEKEKILDTLNSSQKLLEHVKKRKKLFGVF